ncbi:MAG: pirin family protein [Steroidobacteraceae bacterium]
MKNLNQTVSGTREVMQLVRGQATSDGDGVKLTRVIGGRALGDLDPFLLLDEFGSDSSADYIGGFPSHPHRGFETVTYMLEGRMRHRDNQGNEGLLVAGSVQWMTAGRGIVHSEMPEQDEGRMRGFQLWVNLPAKDKMTAPRYQDIAPERIPLVRAAGGAEVRVIAGEHIDADGTVTRGPVSGIAIDPLYFDVALPKGASFEHALPADHNAFLYVFEGQARVGDRDADVVRGDLAVLAPGDRVRVATPVAAARFILVAGRPLGEPVVKYGPFVMNTRAQIVQAVDDYSSGRFT